ncbi:MAG: hypothetical protein CMO07_02075 [Thalassospira sp.]|uniref:hypothetical protein n=1 Tax=unclassified Thalassospira TaxID=2648997 RepID=UPI000C4BAC4F|nr:hypothetical protein [Thalassospira sp. UBA4513]MBE69548.1 hypothetical protein [Thalassospira sp.]HAI28262.1 hypothetical protein [Thalassospira sp.]|tara:strand:+ start:426 stop:689 length:264 start_codon:yes stop_codon:yes gene_type:complete
MKNAMIVFASLMFMASPAFANGGDEESASSSSEDSLIEQVQGATQKQKCWSAKNCTGKVLSNRDAHNCKDKSKGKSWESKFGVCTNL